MEMHCKICEQKLVEIIADGKDYMFRPNEQETFAIGYCASCEVAYTYPEMTFEQLSEYYPQEYMAYNREKGPMAFMQTVVYHRDLRRLKRYASNLQIRIDKVFEIGAGRGEFLHHGMQAGFDAAGCDLSPDAIKAARNLYGILLNQENAEEIRFDNRYDLIVMRHVLEHVNNPKSILENIYQKGLKDDGIILLKLPRFNCSGGIIFGKYWSGYDIPRHRIHFSSRGIIKILEEIGFRDIKIIDETNPVDFDRSLAYGKSDNCILQLYRKLPKYVRYILTLVFYCHRKPTGRMMILAIKR